MKFFKLSTFMILAAVMFICFGTMTVKAWHPAIEAKYAQYQSQLGNATSGEMEITGDYTPPSGTSGRIVIFQNGIIILHTSGSRNGQAFAIWGSVEDKYATLHGSGSFLSLPVTDNLTSGVSGAGTGVYNEYAAFEGGSIQHHLNGDHQGETFAIGGAIHHKWGDLGYADSQLGFPVTDQLRSGSSGSGTGVINDYAVFEGGSIQHHLNGDHAGQTYWIGRGLHQKWGSVGYGDSGLGFPICDEHNRVSSTSGTSCQIIWFERGSITYHNGGSFNNQAFILNAGIDSKWRQLGIEDHVLGFPISDEQQSGQSGAPGSTVTNTYATFEGGVIQYHQNGPHYGQVFWLGRGIRDKWISIGAGSSVLGFPISDESVSGTSGAGTDVTNKFAVFENGSVQFHENGDNEGDCFYVPGCFYTCWAGHGYGSSVYGFPVSDPHWSNGKQYIDFECGFIVDDGGCQAGGCGNPTPTPSGSFPFNLKCPWIAGETWQAGGAGSWYGEGWHTGNSHYAIDFNRRTASCGWASDQGEPILAVASGRIAEIASTYGGGNHIVIEHDGGYRSQHLHLQNYGPVTLDQWVAQGTVIGYCGNTGAYSQGSHLHFVLFGPDGSSVRPSPMSGYDLNDGANGTCMVSDNAPVWLDGSMATAGMSINDQSFHAREHMVADLEIINPGDPQVCDAYVVLKIGNEFYSYPSWTKGLIPFDLNLKGSSKHAISILDVDLPDNLPQGGPYTILSILTDKDGHQISTYGSATFQFDPCNILENGSFENEMSPWILESHLGYSDADRDCNESTDGSCSAVITQRDVSPEFYQVQLKQVDFPLTAGQQYRLSFDAGSNFPREFWVTVMGDETPWDNYGLFETVQLNNTWQNFAFTFTSNISAGSATRLSFALGVTSESVWIDNVRLTKLP